MRSPRKGDSGAQKPWGQFQYSVHVNDVDEQDVGIDRDGAALRGAPETAGPEAGAARAPPPAPLAPFILPPQVGAAPPLAFLGPPRAGKFCSSIAAGAFCLPADFSLVVAEVNASGSAYTRRLIVVAITSWNACK